MKLDTSILMPSFAVIFPAAGRSSRFGGGRNKLMEPLGDVAVLLRSMEVFLARQDVTLAVMAVDERIQDWLAEPPARQHLMKYAPNRLIICGGGASRAGSVLNGLRAVPESIEWVAVHDAARPLVSAELIDRTLAAALQRGAAAPAMPAVLTIKRAAGPLPARVEATLPRQDLWAMQTPQIMRRSVLLEALERSPLPLEQITDDIQALELAGHEAWLVAGEERNIKITTQSDLRLAETLL